MAGLPAGRRSVSPVQILAGARGEGAALVRANALVQLEIGGGEVARRRRHVNPVSLIVDTAHLHRVIALRHLLADLRREDELDQEVKRLLEQHLRGVNRASIDYEELFRKAKAQVVKDRKLVI